MLEIVTSLSGPYWSGVATVISIGTVIVALAKILKGQAQRVFFELIDKNLVNKPNLDGVNLTVSAHGKRSTALHRRTVFIFNRTRKALDNQDFVGNPFTFKKTKGTVYYTRQVRTTSESEYILDESDEEITVKYLILPSGSCIILDIYHDGCVNGPLICHPREKDLLKRYDVSSEAMDYKLIPLVILAPILWIYGAIQFFRTFGDSLIEVMGAAGYLMYVALVPLGVLLVLNYTINKVITLSKSPIFRGPAEVDFIRYMEQPVDLSSVFD